MPPSAFGSAWAKRVGSLSPAGVLLALCAFALLFNPGPWSAIWNGGLPHAWDGSGQYAAAKLYADSIFPDVFGWLPQYVAGTPFPNYYPPLFQWLVGAVTVWLGVPFDAAFKAVLVFSALAMPIAIWRLARSATGRSAIGVLAAVAAFPLLFDKRSYHPLGLSYASTFLAGLYTQPLGFLCAALWYECFSRARRRARWLGSALLLALVFLSSLFAAALAGMLWAGTAGYAWFRTIRARAPRARRRLRAVAAWQSLTLLIALSLAGFWLVPMLAERAFFVTRPMETASSELTNPLLFVWYAVAAAGVVVWMRRPTAGAVPVLFTLALGYIGICAANQEVGLPWMPLHAPRSLSTLNFLAAVPVGVAVSHAVRGISRRFKARVWRRGTLGALAAGAVLLLALRPLVEMPDYRLAFYSDSNQDFRRIDPILRFASTHQDGLYIVEQVPLTAVGPALDSRALSAYLGMQGNESASFVFRESPISSLLLSPLAGTVSAGRDTFELSSMLADDADFLRQNLDTHLRQADEYRARYFVVVSNAAKARLARMAAERYVRHDFGVWTVFEMTAAPRPEAVPMATKPVLVLTSFTAKLARQSDYNFLRLAEEEFMNPPGLPIAFRPDYRADQLPDAAMFSGLVVESYEYGDIQAAFGAIQRFSRQRPTVPMEADSPLFRLLQGRLGELGRVSIVRREPSNSDRWIGVGRPVSYRRDSVRRTWTEVKAALAPALQDAPADPASTCEVTWIPVGQRIRCGGGAGEAIPVRVGTSFHPDWRAVDGRPVLMLSPSVMYTTVRGVAELRFGRSGWERAAVAFSALSFAAVWAGILVRRL
jgi:hypothetical protein